MEYFEQGVKKQKNFTMFTVFAIVFGALALISVVFNAINYISSISYYVENYGATYGYTWSSMLMSYFYTILEPLATFGGLAVLMLAANSIVCKLSAQTQSESITEAVVEEFATDEDNQEDAAEAEEVDAEAEEA